MIRFKYGGHTSPWYPSAAVAGPIAALASGHKMEYLYSSDGLTITDVRDVTDRGEAVVFEWK